MTESTGNTDRTSEMTPEGVPTFIAPIGPYSLHHVDQEGRDTTLPPIPPEWTNGATEQTASTPIQQETPSRRRFLRDVGAGLAGLAAGTLISDRAVVVVAPEEETRGYIIPNAEGAVHFFQEKPKDTYKAGPLEITTDGWTAVLDISEIGKLFTNEESEFKEQIAELLPNGIGNDALDINVSVVNRFGASGDFTLSRDQNLFRGSIFTDAESGDITDPNSPDYLKFRYELEPWAQGSDTFAVDITHRTARGDTQPLFRTFVEIFPYSNEDSEDGSQAYYDGVNVIHPIIAERSADEDIIKKMGEEIQVFAQFGETHEVYIKKIPEYQIGEGYDDSVFRNVWYDEESDSIVANRAVADDPAYENEFAIGVSVARAISMAGSYEESTPNLNLQLLQSYVRFVEAAGYDESSYGRLWFFPDEEGAADKLETIFRPVSYAGYEYGEDGTQPIHTSPLYDQKVLFASAFSTMRFFPEEFLVKFAGLEEGQKQAVREVAFAVIEKIEWLGKANNQGADALIPELDTIIAELGV